MPLFFVNLEDNRLSCLQGESWDTIFADVERIIMPGITHWQSPHMHAYFPALNSPPSLLGDMLADAINCLGFTWVRNLLRIHIFFVIKS